MRDEWGSVVRTVAILAFPFRAGRKARILRVGSASPFVPAVNRPNSHGWATSITTESSRHHRACLGGALILHYPRSHGLRRPSPVRFQVTGRSEAATRAGQLRAMAVSAGRRRMSHGSLDRGIPGLPVSAESAPHRHEETAAKVGRPVPVGRGVVSYWLATRNSPSPRGFDAPGFRHLSATSQDDAIPAAEP
jgi:hypothetical protein